ncbi:MAG TPA: hypothetical protein PLX95_03225 [bacterium]|nr:hypothetical protein [bacterium]
MPITETLNPEVEEEVEETEIISSLFDPIYIPSEISPDRKYDDGNSPEEMTKDFMVRNGIITKKPSKSGGDRDNYDRKMSADFKDKQSILNQKDDLRDAFETDPVLPVSEALWENEDGGNTEPDWKIFLGKHGHTPDNDGGKEHTPEELTEKEKSEARRQAYFGRDRY